MNSTTDSEINSSLDIPSSKLAQPQPKTLDDDELITRQQLYNEPPGVSDTLRQNHLTNLFKRKPSTGSSGMEEISVVCDGVYLTSFGGVESNDLKKLGIRCVVNATMELPMYNAPGIKSVRIALGESKYEDIFVHLSNVADLIHEVVLDGDSILLYCTTGISRSAALVMAYLVKYKQMTLEQAYSYLRTKRHTIHPSNGFFYQLVDFERKTHGTNSVTMEWNELARAYIPDVYLNDYFFRNLLHSLQ